MANTSDGKHNASHNPAESRETAAGWRRVLLPELRDTLRRFDKTGASGGNNSYESERNVEKILSSEQLTRDALSNIAVVAFIGQSGTGKSTRAIKVAGENEIYYIIDDGLLINGSRIVAGTSAKKAPTKIESVRQAIFVDPTRSEVMRRALVENMPKALMILGTSDSMLEKICTNLWLNQPSMLIRIEDVSTEEERRLARNTRLSEGMHTIPVPSMEIKHEFSGYFSDPFSKLRQRLDRERGITPIAPESERTVVRPTFSSLGSYSISDDALLDLIKIVLKDIPGIAEVTSFKTEKKTYGVAISLNISIFYGFDAQDVLSQAQQRVGAAVEEFTSITINEVNVRADRLVHADT
ncbi:MAG: Asp23/Gls24 family envelope stress response protein [Clostridiales bacterium]|nr:Asp23/Gls24 family envelope stress response protein [Clostridiales bacterium]